jgi:hypothetical protein
MLTLTEDGRTLLTWDVSEECEDADGWYKDVTEYL